MFIKLLLLFTLVPMLELYLLLEIGKVIGAPLTIAIVATTGFVGVLLAKSEGFSIIRRLQNQLAEGEMPGNILMDGLFILVGGAFLLTPGLITDTVGFIFLIPFTRAPIREMIKRKLARMLSSGEIDVYIRRS